MNLLFLEYKAGIIELLGGIGLVLENSKEIDYGEQLRFISDTIELKITLYYNKKNAFKYVINKVTPDAFSGIITKQLQQGNIKPDDLNKAIENEKHSYELWAGSDESGKGDYFGPLVVAAFACDRQIVDRLIKCGVKDSKLFNDDSLSALAEKLLLEYHGRYQYIVLMPEKYNELYKKFSVNKPGLNEMLAWLHSRVIGDLYSKHKFENVIIDKFANEKLIRGFVSKNCDAELKIITKAESDIAVATASIIARFLYLKKMDELSEQYGVKLLKGASLKVKAYKKGINKELLPFLAKMHFKM